LNLRSLLFQKRKGQARFKHACVGFSQYNRLEFPKGDVMNKKLNDNSLVRQPGAWLPIAISLSALIFLMSYVAFFGIHHNLNADEGTPARIFQLLMLIQLPIIAYFAIKWLPKRPKQSLLILALQSVAWIIPIITVIWLESL
jgi:hypothetical protein